jgi:glycosyltransferase involved in cell wall biosynthesis
VTHYFLIDMMRIVSIAPSFIPSYTANSIQVVKASHALMQAGHQVTLLVPGETRTGWEEIQGQYGLRTPFSIQWVPENLRFRRYDFAFKAIQLARGMDPDLIYTWMLQAAVLALWHDLPTILELHDRVTGRLGPWLFRRFWRNETQKLLLTNTGALRSDLMKEFNLESYSDEILVAPNGVELERYQDLPSSKLARQQLKLKQGFTAGYTGHFYAGRGMELMVDLAKALPEVNFLWVGGDPADVRHWRDLLHTEGVNNITLTGFVDNAFLPMYQAASDVLLMPYGRKIAGSGGGDTAQVASPMKMFEYMAAGRAILSSDLPVIHEILDERSAVFCQPGDLDAWKSALIELRDHPEQGEKLGKNAQAAVEAYTWRARAERALQDFVDN